MATSEQPNFRTVVERLVGIPEEGINRDIILATDPIVNAGMEPWRVDGAFAEAYAVSRLAGPDDPDLAARAVKAVLASDGIELGTVPANANSQLAINTRHDADIPLRSRQAKRITVARSLSDVVLPGEREVFLSVEDALPAGKDLIETFKVVADIGGRIHDARNNRTNPEGHNSFTEARQRMRLTKLTVPVLAGLALAEVRPELAMTSDKQFVEKTQIQMILLDAVRTMAEDYLAIRTGVAYLPKRIIQN